MVTNEEIKYQISHALSVLSKRVERSAGILSAHFTEDAGDNEIDMVGVMHKRRSGLSTIKLEFTIKE